MRIGAARRLPATWLALAVVAGCAAPMGATDATPDASSRDAPAATDALDAGATDAFDAAPDVAIAPRDAADVRTVVDAAHDAAVTITNPVIASDFPDPFVLRVGATYHAYATNIGTASGPLNIPHAVSTDLARWSIMNDALPHVGAWSSAAAGLIWAPGVLEISATRYVMFYASQRRGTGQQCIGLAVAASPAGPFMDSSAAPLICNTSDPALLWSIDPSPVRDRAGTPFLVWRQDAPGGGTDAAIRQLAANGGGFAAGSAQVTLLTRTATWENPVMENPSIVAGPGTSYVLFYSANRWDTASYGIGYARCASITGPCTKATSTGPWFSSFGAIQGAGGEDFFTAVDGRTWMSMHGWTAPHVGYAAGGARSLWIFPFDFDASGRPQIMAP